MTPAPLTLKELRNTRLDALVRGVIAPALYAARQAHELGAVDPLTWNRLTPEQQQPFIERATQAVWREHPLQQEHAVRMARIQFGRILDSYLDPEIKIAEIEEGSTVGRYVRALLKRLYLYMTSEQANVCGDLVATYRDALVPMDPVAAAAKRRELSARFGGDR